MADAEVITKPSRRSIVGALITAPIIALVGLPARAASAADFDAAAYLKMWRDYGNVVTLATTLKGNTTISIYFPDKATFPPNEELQRFRTGARDDPSWQRAVIDLLRAEQGSDF